MDDIFFEKVESSFLIGNILNINILEENLKAMR